MIFGWKDIIAYIEKLIAPRPVPSRMTFHRLRKRFPLPLWRNSPTKTGGNVVTQPEVLEEWVCQCGLKPSKPSNQSKSK